MRDINKLEKSEAKKDGAQLVPNSGRGSQKGDAKFPEYLIDYKFNTKSFSLTHDNWEKLRKQAWYENHREPLVSVVFTDGPKVAIIDWDRFLYMREITTIYEDLSEDYDD